MDDRAGCRTCHFVCILQDVVQCFSYNRGNFLGDHLLYHTSSRQSDHWFAIATTGNDIAFESAATGLFICSIFAHDSTFWCWGPSLFKTLAHALGAAMRVLNSVRKVRTDASGPLGVLCNVDPGSSSDCMRAKLGRAGRWFKEKVK